MPACSKCSENKDQTEFYFHRTKQRYERRCLSCKSKYGVQKNQELRDRNRAFVRSFKDGRPCIDCNQLWHFCQLDFDHIDPSTKKFELWDLGTQSLSVIQLEIEKCELVCANCHRERTQSKFGLIKIDALPANARYSSFINELKSNKPCVDCSGRFPYYVMDYDHLDQKDFELNRARQSRTDKQKVLVEIKKCDLICVNCHRLRTFTRKSQTSFLEESPPL